MSEKVIYYAKTNPVETIKEHTDCVLMEYYILKKYYKVQIDNVVKEFIDTDEFWDILHICCYYHDFGKCNVQFQNKLRRKLKLEEIPCVEHQEIYHNYLSPAFLSKEDRKKIPKELKKAVYQSIAYHHERDLQVINEMQDSSDIREYISDILYKEVDNINKHMESNVEKIFTKYVSMINLDERIKSDDENYKFYIMLKGLIHRLDHSGSAHIDVEEYPNKDIGICTESFFSENNWSFRKPQQFAQKHRNENILMIASTGIGKTESALLWIDKSKAFFTLPLRVSLNALFSRVKDNIGYKSVGLLHSTAIDYMDEQGDEDAYRSYETASLYSKKLCFSTIDQIFKYPFKYKGYEKILATLSYSKVVIDEIQAYSPEIAAVILYAVKQLVDMGGKFMIMTATLPRIYKDKLNEFGIKFQIAEFISDKIRHRIILKDCDICDSIKNIIDKGKDHKVLVIANTVDKATEIYKRISDYSEGEVSVKLLHSMFNNIDRSEKEDEIKKFTMEDNHENGIWVSTQIVEASLDVDFDYLFTEMSTLDSQFQRYGRCYRKREYNSSEPNVYIFCDNVSGIKYVYDEEIFNLSIKLLKPYDKRFLKEEVKVNLVDKLYSKEMLNETEFYKRFTKACHDISVMQPYSTTSSEAQKTLRDINSISVIPEKVYNNNLDLFEQLSDPDVKDKGAIFRKINKLSISVSNGKITMAKKKNESFLCKELDEMKGLYKVNAKYDYETGLNVYELDDCNFI